ncbi:MAG: CarD family transcriptional regulator [Xanthomonadales bacterium]
MAFDRRPPINIKQGTHIHHPQHGVGKVESIRKRSFYGQAAATYAQLYFEREELTLTVLAKDASDTIRTVISADEAQDLLDQIKHWNGSPKKQWKARADAHRIAIESGDPLEYGKVVKGLSRMQEDSPLRQQDRAHLKQSMELLTEELARALKKRPRQAEKLILEAIDA